MKNPTQIFILLLQQFFKKMEKTARRKSATQLEINNAESLYSEHGWTLERISQMLDRDVRTVSMWRDKYNWEASKQLLQTGPLKLKTILMAEALRIAKGEKRTDENGDELPAINADSISKLTKAIDYFNQKLGAEACKDFLVELEIFIASICNDLKTIELMQNYHKQFLIYKIEQESGN